MRIFQKPAKKPARNGKGKKGTVAMEDKGK